MILRIVLLSAMAIVFTLAAIEIRSWQNPSKSITKQQKVYRILAALMLEIVIVMTICGPIMLGVKNALFALAYWAFTLALAFGLVFIALMDMKVTLSSYQNRHTEMLQKFVDEEMRKNQR